MEVLRGILSDEAPDSDRWRSDLPAEFHRILRWLLEKDATRRPSAAELERALAGIPEIASSAGCETQPAVGPNPPNPKSVLPDSAPTPGRRRWWPW
jgi:hypothetical protein